MKASRAVTFEGRAFRKLVYILFIVMLLAASVVGLSKRSEAFVGYAEKNEQHSKCSDSMDVEACASYRDSRMCKTGQCDTKTSCEYANHLSKTLCPCHTSSASGGLQAM